MSWEDILKSWEGYDPEEFEISQLPKPLKRTIRFQGKHYTFHEVKKTTLTESGAFYVYWPSDREGNKQGRGYNHEILELDVVDGKIVRGDYR